MDEKIVDKSVVLVEEGMSISVQFMDNRMAGYFSDWWEEVGKEQFDAAIIDL